MSLDVGETFMTSHAVDAGSIQKLEERKEFLRAIVESTRNFSQFRYSMLMISVGLQELF